MNTFNIERSFKQKVERNWDTIYWMIDIHETILPGKYCSDQEYEPYDGSIETLKWISDRDDMRIIIWTSSYARDYSRLASWFARKHGICFDYHNSNPECGNTELAEFTTKPYFNILLDDKGGFVGEEDWFTIKDELKRIGEW